MEVDAPPREARAGGHQDAHLCTGNLSAINCPLDRQNGIEDAKNAGKTTEDILWTLTDWALM